MSKKRLTMRKMTKEETATCIAVLCAAKWRKSHHIYVGKTIRPAEVLVVECVAALKRQLGES